MDTKGDHDLANDESLSFEVIADNRAHPGFSIDFCQMAQDLLLQRIG